MHQRVLVVAGEGELRDRLLQAFETFSAEAVEVPSAQRAIELARELPVHLLVVRYPIDGMKFKQFVRTFRDSGSESRGAQLVVLCPGRSIGGLKRSAKTGTAFLKLDSPLEDLIESFTDFLRRSPRFTGNMLVGADLELPGGKVKKMLQVINISDSGMLLRTRTALDAGDQFQFELQIPELKSPILGRAEVVRTLDPVEDQKSRQIGVRIISFSAGSRERLAKFLKVRRLPPAIAK